MYLIRRQLWMAIPLPYLICIKQKDITVKKIEISWNRYLSDCDKYLCVFDLLVGIRVKIGQLHPLFRTCLQGRLDIWYCKNGLKKKQPLMFIPTHVSYHFCSRVVYTFQCMFGAIWLVLCDCPLNLAPANPQIPRRWRRTKRHLGYRFCLTVVLFSENIFSFRVKLSQITIKLNALYMKGPSILAPEML